MIRTLSAYVLVVFASLLSLRINPFTPPLFGGRVSLQISAMILVMIQTNPAQAILGRLTYLVWSDVFAMCQFAILSTALCASVYIHYLFRVAQIDQANDVDAVVRNVIPFALYPLMVVSMVVTGLSQAVWTGAVVFATGSLVCVGITVAYEMRSRRLKRALVRQLQTLDMSLESSQEVLEQAFNIFDQDNSGSLGARELGDLLRMMYPHFPRKKMGAVLLELPDQVSPVMFASVIERLSEQLFVEPAEPKSARSPKEGRQANAGSSRVAKVTNSAAALARSVVRRTPSGEHRQDGYPAAEGAAPSGGAPGAVDREDAALMGGEAEAEATPAAAAGVATPALPSAEGVELAQPQPDLEAGPV